MRFLLKYITYGKACWSIDTPGRSPPNYSVGFSHILKIFHELPHTRIGNLDVVGVDRKQGKTCSPE